MFLTFFRSEKRKRSHKKPSWERREQEETVESAKKTEKKGSIRASPLPSNQKKKNQKENDKKRQGSPG